MKTLITIFFARLLKKRNNKWISNPIETQAKTFNKLLLKNTRILIFGKYGQLGSVFNKYLGKNSNVGAGTITCNYDGVKKFKTIISDNVFIGSNSSLVAPVKIDKNSVVGAGSVITKSVRKKTLVLSRAPQIEIKNYKRKKK